MAVKNFAVIGVAGHVAPRHLRAIRAVGGRVVAAVDPCDAAGVLDELAGWNVPFFTEIERFDRHLEKLRRGPPEGRADTVVVTSPNYLHDAHCRLGLRVRADVVCEKPLVLNPWNLDALEAIEAETGHRVRPVLQLRHHPAIVGLEGRLRRAPGPRREVALRWIAPRGAWYDVSWKGSVEKSGGLATNIGIHLFDLLLWLFGPAGDLRITTSEPRRVGGVLECERARVRWFLSADPSDAQAGAQRRMRVDGEDVDFTGGFDELHTRAYEEIAAGRGFGIADARPSIELVARIRTSEVRS